MCGRLGRMVAGVLQFQSAGQARTDQQQTGDELGGSGRVDGHRMRRRVHSVGRHRWGQRERQSPRLPVVFDVRAQLLQPVQYRLQSDAHRPVRRRRTAPARRRTSPVRGTNRITVPARPQYTSTSPVNRPDDGGVTRTVVSSSGSTWNSTPSDRNAPIIRSVSPRTQQADQRDRMLPHRGKIRYRFDSDLLPGIVTVADNGRVASGAGQGFWNSLIVSIVSGNDGDFGKMLTMRSEAWSTVGTIVNGRMPRGIPTVRPRRPRLPQPTAGERPAPGCGRPPTRRSAGRTR